jgi:hypothetical protein
MRFLLAVLVQNNGQIICISLCRCHSWSETPSPTPTKEADEGRTVEVAREEVIEIEPREEN